MSKKLIFLPLVLIFLLAIATLASKGQKEKEKYIASPCPNMPPGIEKAVQATKRIWERVQKAPRFELGNPIDLGFYKVTILKVESKKEYPWQEKIVKGDCPFLIVDFEVEKTRLGESKEKVNPLFLAVSKQYLPTVSIYAIFEKYYYTRSCDVIEGQLGFEEKEKVGTKKRGRCVIPYREDWGKEKYLLVQLSQTTKGTTLLLPLPLSQTKILSVFKMSF